MCDYFILVAKTQMDFLPLCHLLQARDQCSANEWVLALQALNKRWCSNAQMEYSTKGWLLEAKEGKTPVCFYFLKRWNFIRTGFFILTQVVVFVAISFFHW